MHKWSVAEILCSSEIFIKYFSDEDSGVIISITFLNAQMENASNCEGKRRWLQWKMRAIVARKRGNRRDF